MLDFGQQVGDFAAYFGAVAQISGSLLGLVFVALTFNPKAFALRHDIAMRSLAQQVFADFLMVMVISLLLLVPHTVARQIGGILILLALVGTGRIVRSVIALRRGSTTSRSLLWQFWLSLLGHIGILVAGLLLFAGGDNAPMAWSALVSSPVLLLTAGSRSAWLLVTQSAE